MRKHLFTVATYIIFLTLSKTYAQDEESSTLLDSTSTTLNPEDADETTTLIVTTSKPILQGRAPKHQDTKKPGKFKKTGRQVFGRLMKHNRKLVAERDKTLGMHKKNTLIQGRGMLQDMDPGFYEFYQNVFVELAKTYKLLKDKQRTITKGRSMDSEPNKDMEWVTNYYHSKEMGMDGAQPGILAVYGENAFTFLTGISVSTGALVPVAAAANYGDGRMAVFTHEMFFANLTPNECDRRLVFLQSATWSCRAYTNYNRTYAVLEGFDWVDGIVEHFEKGFQKSDITKITLDELLSQKALTLKDKERKYDALILPSMKPLNNAKPEFFEYLHTYVKDGGAVVIAHKYDDSDDPRINDFLREFGITFIPFSADRAEISSWRNKKWFQMDEELFKKTHGGQIAAKVIQILKSGKVPEGSNCSEMTSTVQYTATYANKDELLWISDLQDAIKALKPLAITKDKPLAPSELNCFQVSFEYFLSNDFLESDEITVYSTAKNFPGEVDKDAVKKKGEVQTVKITLKNDPKNPVSSWTSKSYGFSTGLYAPAGSKISLVIKGDTEFEFQVKIGCHSDDLRQKEKWLRFPQVVVARTFVGNSADISSPFGGLIYIENIRTAKKSKTTIDSFTFDVIGAVSTPSFFLGKTSLKDWKEKIKKIKSPWAEFVTDRIALSIPGDIAQSVEDPEKLMKFWSTVIDQMSDLVGIAKEENFQRIVFDIDVANSNMHAGNPIVANIGTAKDAVNLELLKKPSQNSWAFYHEIGHNLQELYGGYWTLDGCSEVTNNIFGMYVFNLISKLPLEDTNEKGHLKPDYIKTKIEDYLKNGKKYEKDFKTDPDLGLIYYYHMIKLFGWDAFKRVFKAYSKLTEFPEGEDKKIGQWLLILSTAVELNLVELFDSWGIKVPSEVVNQVSDLPESGYLITDLYKPIVPNKKPITGNYTPRPASRWDQMFGNGGGIQRGSFHIVSSGPQADDSSYSNMNAFMEMMKLKGFKLVS